MIKSLAVLGFWLATVALAAQEGGRVVTFEVASVKRSDVTRGNPFPFSPGRASPGGRWSAFAPLSTILRFLYGVKREQIIGGPSWFDTDVFVITAKAVDAAASSEQIAEMAKQLLAERFNLRLHIEQRPFDVHAMILAHPDGKLGPGLRTTTCEMPPGAGEAPRPIFQPSPSGRPRCGEIRRDIVDGLWIFRIRGHAVRNLISMHFLEALVGTPVVDRTGLAGTFDIDLEYVPDTLINADANSTLGPSVLTAMKEQLGLKFERRREAMDVIVIDRVDHPSPD